MTQTVDKLASKGHGGQAFQEYSQTVGLSQAGTIFQIYCHEYEPL